MNILVTGATGFIGGHLVNKLLEEGHTVIGLDNKFRFWKQVKTRKTMPNKQNYKLKIADIRQFNQLPNIKPDAVFHLAALINARESNQAVNINDYVLTNVLGTANIVSKYKSSKIIFISSIAVKEKKSSSVYAETKKVCEKGIKAMKGLNYCIVRPFNVFGPFQESNALIPSVFRSIKKGNRIKINGDGKQLRSFIYVKDLVNELVELIHSNKKIVELGSKNNLPVLRMVQLCFKEAGVKERIELVSGSDFDSVCSNPIDVEYPLSVALHETWMYWENRWFV